MKTTPIAASAIAAFAFSTAALAQCQPHMPPPGPPPLTTWTAKATGAPSPGAPSAPKPASPAGPGPATPKAPMPENPDRTGPATPTRGAATPVRMGPRTGGIALTFERGATAKERLKVDWQHPVPPARKTEGTQAAGPMPLDDVLALLWENDPRPLLVLRECGDCKGSDDALLSRSLKNDKTLLLTKWFRTVRVPQHVVDPAHPFYRLFQSLSNDTGTPHVFLLAHPGAEAVCFNGAQTQTQLWKGLADVLAVRYAKDANKAVKEWLAVLDTFDTIDARRFQLQEQLNEVRASEGPDSARAKKLAESLGKLKEEHDEALAREARIKDLGLAPMPGAVAAAK